MTSFRLRPEPRTRRHHGAVELRRAWRIQESAACRAGRCVGPGLRRGDTSRQGASMFQSLSDRLSGILDKLTRRGSLTDSDVAEAMREVRRALLEADVALEVVREFTDKVKEKAVGQEVIKSVTPGQMVVKI